MPVYKRNSKSLKKRTYRRKPTTATVVKRVVKSMTETKALIVAGEEQNFGNTVISPSTWYSLNNLNKGTESHNRVGDKVSPTFLIVTGKHPP